MRGAGRTLSSLRVAAITATTELLLLVPLFDTTQGVAKGGRGGSDDGSKRECQSESENKSSSMSKSESENTLRKGILLSTLKSILDADENDQHVDFIRTSHSIAGAGICPRSRGPSFGLI